MARSLFDLDASDSPFSGDVCPLQLACHKADDPYRDMRACAMEPTAPNSFEPQAIRSGPLPEPAVCERCGRPTPMAIGGHNICLECYDVVGSCCLEFGADDIWAERSDL